MDPISFTVGIVGLTGLFTVCMDVIDKVDSYKEFGLESRSVVAQFKADKHLFTKWAQDVGIDKNKPKNYNTRLDDQETNSIVQEILSSIQEIFSKTEGTMSNLQPVVEAGPTSFPDGIRFLNTRQKSQKPEGAISKRSRIGWSLRSKAKFISQVQQFGALVQRLQSLVPPDGLTGPENVSKGTIDSDLSSRNDKDAWFSNSQQLLIEMKNKIEHETRKELDIWLGASWTNDVYDNFIRRRLDGTCDWILSREAFLEWISPDFPSGTSKILWITGPAGHGKSILCARVVQYLSTMLKSPLAYYFCSSDSESRRDPLNIIRSWVSQIISDNRDAFELACSRWEAKDGRNASQTDIIDVFKTIIQHIPHCTLVGDGLDECIWAEEPTGFFESIRRAVAGTNTRILILSRDEPEIRYGFRAIWTNDNNQSLNEYQIRSEDVRPDTILFSRSVIKKKLANKSETLQNELSQRMADRCEGMFLWVKMLEEQLRSGKNKKQLEATIDQAPTALDHLYDRNWAKISNLPDKDKLRAFSILRWAALALRPLTILEITEALLIIDDDGEDLSVDELPDAVDEDYVNSEILGLCGSLLETQKAVPNQDLGSMTLHLTHFSLKQYILCNMPAQGGLLMVNERLRTSTESFQSNVLAKLCLRYLNFRGVWQESLQFQKDVDRRPFRDYVAGSWHYHIREYGSNYKEVVELTNALFNPKTGKWESWKRWFDVDDDKSKMPESQREITSSNPLFYASLLGLRDTVIYLLEETNLDVNYVDEYNRTALQAAALKGQSKVVKLLLEKAADVAIANREGWTALNLASDSGHVDVVKLLLEKGTDVTVATQRGWTPLNVASNNGHVDIVKLLLEKGADVTVANSNGWTPLNSASINGHVDIVRLLLDRGANVAVTDRDGWMPLNSASRNGHIDVVKLLLEEGADMTIANSKGWTPLDLASSNGHVNIVRLLLDQGADVTVTDNYGWTPLNSASSNGHIDVVKLLLEEGVDVTIANSKGWTPLNLASLHGHVDVVRLLLDRGADVTIANNNGWTPLNSASLNGHVDIVRLLLDQGADVPVATRQGVTPLNSASEKGHVDVVKLLIENGADVTIVDNDRWTPLNSASLNGHVDVVRLLLDRGANVAIVNNNGWTPLNSASLNGHVDVVRLLLDRGADITIATRQGVTPLNSASEKGHVGVVKLLIENGADVTIVDNDRWTPLNSASLNGHVDVVRLLLDRGADVAVATRQGVTPLNSASRKGHVDVVKLLIENGADVMIGTQSGRASLNLASSNGHVDVVKLLLEKGANFDVRGREGQNALQAVASKGSHSLLQMLLEKSKNVDIQDNILEDALHLGCIQGHITVVEQLIDLGVSPNMADEHGWTPLLCASWFGQGQILDYLLSKTRDRDLLSSIKTIPPSTWSIVDKSTCLELDGNLTCVRYSNNTETGELPAALILANHPVPLYPDGYYYEVEVIDSGDTGEIGLGLCSKYVPLDSFPGWNFASWGYHGDDGKKYFESTETPYGTTFKTGDIIGCYIRLKDNISFTLNGASLGVAFQGILGKLYPAVGMRSRGAHIRVNFGQEVFMYDSTKA